MLIEFLLEDLGLHFDTTTRKRNYNVVINVNMNIHAAIFMHLEIRCGDWISEHQALQRQGGPTRKAVCVRIVIKLNRRSRGLSISPRICIISLE